MAKIYIGVGHGGSDPGAVSGKHKEAAYALDIATACTAELKRHGVNVMQSRTSDVTEPSSAKIKECNTFAPDYAADFHLNAGGGDGFECYYSIAGGKSKQYATAIEKAVVQETGQNSRGIKTKKNSSGKDYFGFIRQTNCPANLIEFAFIDNAKDVQIIDTLAERQKMGRATAHGILAQLGIKVIPEVASGASPAPSDIVKNVAVLLPEFFKGDSTAPDYQVKRIQLCLNQMQWTGADGKPLEVDGDFGANTESAVIKFQKAHGIEPTGRMTAQTWRALLVFKR